MRGKKAHISMDTVARVASVASKGCFMASQDDASAFHLIRLHPSAWPLIDFAYGSLDCC